MNGIESPSFPGITGITWVCSFSPSSVCSLPVFFTALGFSLLGSSFFRSTYSFACTEWKKFEDNSDVNTRSPFPSTFAAGKFPPSTAPKEKLLTIFFSPGAVEVTTPSALPVTDSGFPSLK